MDAGRTSVAGCGHLLMFLSGVFLSVSVGLFRGPASGFLVAAGVAFAAGACLLVPGLLGEPDGR